MEELINVKCGLCGKLFEEADDVAYCPECGAPAHRSCWQREGECPCAHLHGEGFRWNSPQQTAHDEAQEYRRQAEADFCEKKYMGVSEREMMYFLNARTPQGLYRMAVLRNMAQQGRKLSFNAFAGILSPYNQFYKGMSAFGLLVLLLDFVTALPQIIIYYTSYIAGNTSELLAENSALIGAMDLLSYIHLGVMILLCLFGDYLYLLYMVKTIKRVRMSFEDESSDEYVMALAEAGRGRMSRVAICFGIQFVLALAAINIFTMMGFGG